MSTGYCNCVTLRAKVRLAIEALEKMCCACSDDFMGDECQQAFWCPSVIAKQVITELKKETGAKSLCPACQDPADHKVHTCGR